MKLKPTYQELEKELQEIRLTNKLIEKSQIIKFLWKNQKQWPVEYVSENVKNIFGYTADDFITGKILYSEIIYPEDLQRVENEVSNQSKTGFYSIEHEPYRIISKAGKIKWLNDITLIRRNEANEITHYEGIIIDITKQKETEKELVESELRWKFAVEGISDGLWDWNLITDEMFFSPQWKKMLDFSENEIHGSVQEWDKRVHPDDKKKVYEDINKHINGEIDYYENEHRVLCKDNTYKWILDRGKIISYTSDNKPERMIGTHSDISERKEAEDKLIEKESHYRQLFNILPYGGEIISTEGIIINCSESTSKMLGYEKEELIGKHITDFVDADSVKIFKQNFPKILKGESLSLEGCMVHKNGSRINILRAAQPILNTDGKITGMLALNIDITERKQMEDALRESEEKYRSLTENINMGIYRNTPGKQGKFIEINNAILKIFGYQDRKELLSKNVSDLYQDSNERRKFNTKLNKNEFVKNEELKLRKKDGTKIICTVSASAVKDENGKIIHFDGVIEDITERKQMEDILRESEEKYRTLVETIEEGITNVDENETIIFANQAAADIFGYSKDEMIGKNLKELTSLEMFKKILEETSTRQKGDSSFYELQILRKNGEERIITVLATPIITENGIHKGSFGIFHDITERKQAEETLKESRDQYESLFNQIADPVVVFDQETKKFLDCNTAMIHKYGYSQDELSGMTPLELHPADEDIENVKINIDDKENVSPNKYLHKGKDGTIYNVETHSREIFYKDRKAWITIIRDITEHKKAEDALKASEIQLRELNATKDKFFSIIAHDLRSPFNTLLGFSELLNEEFDEHSTEEKKKFIGIIYEGLQNTLKLLDNLLYWARSQKGTIVYNPEKINLYLKAKETYDFLNQSAEKKSIKLINQIAENVYVEADIDMLATIIRNLLSNAIKFTHKYGKITIKTFLVPDENNIQYIGISVSDTGVGIPKKMQSKLFDIGEDTLMRGTENEKGTGLGLILCKEFVEKHDGKIWVESEIDKGSTFYFTIPNK